MITKRELVINIILYVFIRSFVPKKRFNTDFTIRRRSIQKILIIKNDEIGDVVLATPAIQAIRDKFPASHIAILIKASQHAILMNNPNLDEIIPVDFKEKQLPHGEIPDIIMLIREIVRIRKKEFFLVIDLRGHRIGLILAAFCGKEYFLSQNLRGKGDLYNLSTKNRIGKHEIERMLDTVRYLGADTTTRKPAIYLTEDDRTFQKEFLERHTLSSHDLIIGIHPGAGRPMKCWNPENYAEVCDAIIERYGGKILIFGSENEKIIARKILNAMTYPAIDLVGELNLRETLALIHICNFFIGNDSGLGHVAAAFGIPVISLHGPGSRHVFDPYGPKSIVIRHEVPCSPCLQFKCTRKEGTCMDLISVQEVLGAFAQQLTQYSIAKGHFHGPGGHHESPKHEFPL